MGFILGFLLGVIAAIILAALGLWLITGRASKEATAKFLQGMALILTHKPKSSESPVSEPNEQKSKPSDPLAPGLNGQIPKPPELPVPVLTGLKSTSSESLLVRSNGQISKEAPRERKTDA